MIPRNPLPESRNGGGGEQGENDDAAADGGQGRRAASSRQKATASIRLFTMPTPSPKASKARKSGQRRPSLSQAASVRTARLRRK
jgi:hypothetical protein